MESNTIRAGSSISGNEFFQVTAPSIALFKGGWAIRGMEEKSAQLYLDGCIFLDSPCIQIDTKKIERHLSFEYE